MDKKYIWNLPRDKRPFDNDFFVIGCGYDIINENLKERHRNLKRETEYHILYFLEGGCKLTMNGKEHIAKAGDIVFFHTDDDYRYTYFDNTETKVYWVHFSGSRCVQFMDELELFESFIKKADTDFSKYFDNIIEETSIRKKHYFKTSSAYLMVLLTTLVRKRTVNQSRLDEVISKMNNINEKDIDLDEYAKICHISKTHFIRIFKEYTGKTPIKYKNDILIYKAKEKLTNTDMSISEISSFLGFENIYYFSTMFKKAVGVSPAEYRKSHR